MFALFKKKYLDFRKYATFDREPFFEIAKKYIKEDCKILDVGAGDGAFADFIGRNDIYLVDGNLESCEDLKKRYQNVLCHKIPDAFEYKNSFFDVVHCSHLIEHLDYKSAYEFLKEIDRIIKPGGYMVISAPLLNEGFYNDFSHIKPYNPAVLLKYFVHGIKTSSTGLIISSNYLKEELIFRHTFTRDMNIVSLGEKDNIINKLFYFIYLIKQKIGFGVYEKSGFTLVLKKNK